MSKFLDKTGLDTFWAKIKNTFVKSVKITSSGSELKNSDGNVVIPLASTSAAGAMSSADKLMLDQTALLVSSTGSNANKAYKLCRFRRGASYGVGIEGIIRGSYVASFKLNSYVYQSSSGSNPWSSSKLSLTYQTVNGVPNAKFYYKVGSATVGDIVDIYVFFPSTYSRYEVGPIAGCKAVPESDNTLNGVYFYNQDVTADWSTLVTGLTEITDNDASGTSASDLPTELKVIAKAKESSGTAPVKVDASGNLSPITVDSTPTAGNTANLVSSDGIKNALDGKEDESNKVNAWQSTPDNTHYPSEKLVKAAFDKSSDVIVTYNTETDRTHKYWKFAKATFYSSRYLFGEWDVILQTNSTFYPFRLIFEAYKSSTSSINLRYAKIVDVKSGTSVSALGATDFYAKVQDGTTTPLNIELWCGLNRDNKSSIAIKELRAGMATTVNGATDTRANSWTYYPNDGGETTYTTKPVTGDGYTVTQFTQMSDKFANYAERIGKPSSDDGSSVVASQIGSKSLPVYVKSDGSIDTCDVESEYKPTSDAPVNGKALAAALANGVAAHSSTSDAASYAESAKDYYAGGNIDSTLRALTSEVNGVVTSLSQQYASIMIKERVSVFCTCHPYAGDVVAYRGVVLDLKQIYVLSNWDSVTDLSPTSRTGLVEFGKICGLTNPSFEFSEWIRDAVHVVINIAGNGGQYYNKFEINVENLQIGRYKFLTLNNMTGSSLTIRINSASLGMYLLLHGGTVQIPERSYHDYVIGAGVCKHVSIIRLPDQIIQGATLTTMRQLVFLADT